MSTTEVRPPAHDGPGPGPGPIFPAEDPSIRVKSPWRSAGELIAAIVLIVIVGASTGHLDLVVVIASIIVIVMMHELGHLLAAKRGGMKVTEYFVGFGPRLWSFRRGETEYGIKALPLGGYVKIPGMTNLEEVDPADESRVYREKPFHSRLLVAVAGSAMHFLMAFVLLWVLLAFVGVPNSDQVQVQGVSTVGGTPGPAAQAGVRAGDVIASVDGVAIDGNVNTLTAAIRDHPGVPVTMVVDRQGRARTLTVTPANGRVEHERGVDSPSGHAPFGVIGVSLGSPVETRSPLHALGSTGADLVHYGWASIVGVVHLFSPSAVTQRFHQVTSAKAANQAAANGTRVQSIIGVGATATDALQAGIGQFLYILIAINIFFGIFNLFPMLPLDGGHVAIAVYEKIRTGRRKVLYHADVAKLMPFTWLMLAFLGVLILPALLTDILHPMANPFG
jgi:membrane-associated protease RseP (regulator of RpoE activity)